MGGGTCILFSVNHRDRVNKMILVDAAGLPNPLPVMAKIVNLPKVGEFLINLKGNFYRKMVLNSIYIHDKAFINDSYLEHVTRFHKVQGTTEASLKILRKQFFDTLPDEV